MSTVASEVETHEQSLERRSDSGGDRFDEVWEGVEVMAPPPKDEHADIKLSLALCFRLAVGHRGTRSVRAGVGVSDRVEDWARNFRVPDVVVFLDGSPSINHGTHWTGSPDFLVEVVSKHDRAKEKLGYYQSIRTREVLLIDRSPRSVDRHSPILPTWIAKACP